MGLLTKVFQVAFYLQRNFYPIPKVMRFTWEAPEGHETAGRDRGNRNRNRGELTEIVDSSLKKPSEIA